ncbi:MAG TPA: Uma2 family endonuclease [Chloroflexota bacterium]|nr:Uma2 family endonuclease [Chloroflexota bacterium]
MVAVLEQARVWTAADLAALPADPDYRYELVEGRLVKMSPTYGAHGRRTSDLHVALALHVRQHQLGVLTSAETGFNLTRPGERRETVLAPDIAFIRMENAPLVDVEEFPRLAPDLAVEVASPTDSRRRMGEKARRWLERGVRLVWVVWPRRREIDIWEPGAQSPRTLTAADTLDGGSVVAGFAIPVAQVCPEHRGGPRRRH